MFTMKKGNRLINDFWNQTKATIWKFLDAMAVNYSVYSTFLRGFYPHLSENRIYVYSGFETVVVVCLDYCGKKEEQTYAESDSMNPVIYKPGCEPRASMVWKLYESMQLMKERLQARSLDVEVYGILLTEADITNVEDLEDGWDALNIKVIDGFRKLKNWSIKVNDDDDLPSKAYVDTITNTAQADDDEEFTRLLEEFINSELDKSEGDDAPDEEGKTEDEEKETTPEESPDDSDAGLDDIVLPSGVIEQNTNVSIKVDILRPFANPRAELDKLIGCADIKRHIDELLALTSYNKTMRELFPQGRLHEVSLHSIFFGRPGTGKTTVCKIYGSLLRQAGALSKGHVVVCDRSTFIGTLWGDEERSVNQVVEMAKGGVLMIDEAYLLNGKNTQDPGKIVVQMLMNILADERQRDIAVVLCGYKEPMMKLLETNPGLQSRFPNRFEFADFTVDELLEITKHRVKEYEYEFTDQAWEKYRRIMAQAYQARDPQTWGNARFVANQLERIYIQHAARCVEQQPAEKLSWRLLTPEDIVPIEVPRQRVKIGF